MKKAISKLVLRNRVNTGKLTLKDSVHLILIGRGQEIVEAYMDTGREDETVAEELRLTLGLISYFVGRKLSQ